MGQKRIPPENWYSIVLPPLVAGCEETPGVALQRRSEAQAAGWDEPCYHGQPVLVLPQSPKHVRNALEACAWYFKREFRYDFVQYLAGEQTDRRDRGWLWVESNYGTSRGVGGCMFRWREWADAPASYGLAWAWLHPFCRRSGKLSKAWPMFQKLYGGFYVEPPLSSAMKAFLRKQNEFLERPDSRTGSPGLSL